MTNINLDNLAEIDIKELETIAKKINEEVELRKEERYEQLEYELILAVNRLREEFPDRSIIIQSKNNYPEIRCFYLNEFDMNRISYIKKED